MIEHEVQEEAEIKNNADEDKNAMDNVESLNIPRNAFIYVASNLYYDDATPSALFGFDRRIYELCKPRKITMRITELDAATIQSFNIKTYIKIGNNIIDTTVLPSSSYVSDMYTEHDDQGGYDPRYRRLHCILIVGDVGDT